MILEDFDREIGFSLMSKKERLISQEVSENSAEIRNNIQAMLDSIKRGIDEFNKMFDTNISVRYRYEYLQQEAQPAQQEEGAADESDTI